MEGEDKAHLLISCVCSTAKCFAVGSGCIGVMQVAKVLTDLHCMGDGNVESESGVWLVFRSRELFVFGIGKRMVRHEAGGGGRGGSVVCWMGIGGFIGFYFLLISREGYCIGDMSGRVCSPLPRGERASLQDDDIRRSLRAGRLGARGRALLRCDGCA